MIAQQYRTTVPAADKAPPAAPARSIVEAMADVMREMRAAGQTVTAETLAIRGDFTNEEVSKHALEASNLARAREVRQVA